jgi:hypothetical protein
MKITDLNGQKIKVTDLIAAIRQAETFKDYHHEPPRPKMDKRRQAYWTDIYNKLMNLKTQLNQKHHEQSIR